ncbi:hypothetical protein EON65_43210, partial [archaeon]
MEDGLDISALNLNEINQKIIELLDENNMLRISLQGETSLRVQLEDRNHELNEKLMEAKEGLQETRNALLKVQQTTELMVSKRDERESQMNKMIQMSRQYEKRISELEGEAGKAEELGKTQTLLSNAKMMLIEKDETISDLKGQMHRAQQALVTIHEELKTITDRKISCENQLIVANSKLKDLERLVKVEAEKVARLQEAEERGMKIMSQQQEKIQELMTKLRKDITETSEIRRAVTRETAVENKIVNGEASEALYKTVNVSSRANMKFDFPKDDR